MKPGSTAYIRMPGGEPDDVLTPATVEGIRPERVDLSMATSGGSLEADDEVVVFYDVDYGRSFLQQTGRVESIQPDGSRKFIELALTSDAISAERRQHARATALTSGALLHLAGRGCPVRDVSVEGFAVISPDVFAKGQTLAVELEYDGQRFRGEASVENTRDLHHGHRRYGMHVPVAEGGDDTLTAGLRSLVREIERIRHKGLPRPRAAEGRSEA